MRHQGRDFATFCLIAVAWILFGQTSEAQQPEGSVHLDVVVTDEAGKPVGGLREPDFRLLDDGNEQRVTSFRAFDTLSAKAEPAVQIVLIVDCVNTGSAELDYIRQGLKRFLSQNNGQLSQPITIVRFAPSGVDFLSNASTDGTALAASVDQIGAISKQVESETFASSLNALTTVVNKVANEPGRKMLIWLGPGWYVPVPGPHVVTTIDEHDHRADYELMVQLLKTMEEGRIALYGGYKDAGFYLRDPLKPVRKVSQVTPRDLALEVLALKSGGHGVRPMITRGSVVGEVLNDFVAEAGTFYSLSFDPPRARGPDEFHELKVVLDRPGLTLRTITGYYNEPEFFQARQKNKKTGIAHQRAIEAPSALASIVYGTGGQTLPLRDPSVTPKAVTPLSATDPVVRDGLFSIDFIVTDATGNPVSNLEPWDFTLLDNGQPAKIRTLRNALAPSVSAPELIFVLDTVNLSPQQLTQTESAIAHFLQRNNGRPDFRCFLYRITRDGLFSSLLPTQDGNMLIQEVEQHKSPRTLWTSVDASKLKPLSLRALGSIAIDQRDIPGHKVAVWIGPGWPVKGGNIGFDEATELSTRLREGRITLDNINLSPKPDQSFDYHDYLEAPRSQKDMQEARMALQVIATHTGGRVLNSSEDLDQDIERCAREVRNFYTLTFNPPHTYTMDEYHHLRVGMAHPNLTVRAPTGYYNEPVYFDSPRPGVEKVNVAHLVEIVHSGNDLQQKLANLELTERLSTPRLDALLNTIQSEKERQALRADADLSIALAPPPDEIANQPPPSAEEQRTILQRTFDYLENVIPKLPDLSASRDTVGFEEPAAPDTESWKMAHQDQTLHFATGEHATVLYRNGHEVDEEKKKLSTAPVVRGVRARDLETRGTFGPILAYVLAANAASPSTLIWKRWERSKDGDLAVFSYRAGAKNAPEITYCCLPEGDGTTLYRNKADTYGEFTVNPDTGAIMRIVINADLNEERDPDVPLIRSQVMVEYGPEELGGKDYTCPKRSVEISRGRSERQLHEWGMVFSVYSYFETLINDSTFDGYHKFGSEMRILPGFEETKGANPPSPANERTVIAQQPAINVPGAPNRVTVVQLTDLVADAKGKDDSETAKKIEHLQLTERLSSAKLATLRAELAGTESRNALTAVADASVFLEPPANETPKKAAPLAAEQAGIMSLAVDYLKKINPKLPDLYANRLTTSFEENWSPKNEKGTHEEHALHIAGEFSATVYYREGKEVVHAHGKQEQELITQGTFGPILSTVIVDMAHSWTQWARWEEGPNGPMAVFQFQVPHTESHYQTSMPTFLPLLGAMDPTAYHGEIGIDPTTGTILRLVLQADPDLGSPLQRADIMVEYGPVVIGGKVYTCPVRSVSIATGELISSGRMTRLDDVVFNDYHVFRTQMRIMP